MCTPNNDCSLHYLHTPQVLPSLEQRLQYLQFLQALQGLSPKQVATVALRVDVVGLTV